MEFAQGINAPAAYNLLVWIAIAASVAIYLLKNKSHSYREWCGGTWAEIRKYGGDQRTWYKRNGHGLPAGWERTGLMHKTLKSRKLHAVNRLAG